MFSLLFTNSIFVGKLKNIGQGYLLSQEYLYKRFFSRSYTIKLIEDFFGTIANIFKHSILIKILIDFNSKGNYAIFRNSFFLKPIRYFYHQSMVLIFKYLAASSVINSIQELKRGMYFLPVKTVSIIILAGIITETSLSLLFSKEILFSGWFLRMVCLFIAINGLSCNLSWEDLKKTSLFWRFVNNNPCKF